jgi:hypothetical protein
LDNTHLPTSAEKGFEVKKIKDLNAKVVLEKWIEFKKLIELEKEDTTRDSQGGSQHIIAMVESFTTKQAIKEATEGGNRS